MTAADVIAALDLPVSTRVDQRVPKKLLAEHGAPTAADKRRINDGIEEVQWLAALKANTIAVPSYRDELREYLEIAVLSAALRAHARADRLGELVHRAVPYPVVLIVIQGEDLAISLAHKRWSQNQASATVLDGDVVAADIGDRNGDQFGQQFRESLAVARQPRADLYELYQGWIDTLLALLAARVTGTFAIAGSRKQAVERHQALREYARLDAESARLRAAARKEKQVGRQVELNLELKRVEQERSEVRQRL